MSLINKMLHDLEDRQADLVLNEGSIFRDIESAAEIGQGSKTPQSRFIALCIIITSLLLAYLCYEVYLNPFFIQLLGHQHDSKPLILTDNNRIVALPLETIEKQATPITAVKEIYSGNPITKDLNLKLDTLNLDWKDKENHAVKTLENNHPESIPGPLVLEQRLTGIHLHSLVGATNIRINLTSFPDYRLFTLDKPDRLFIEIKDITIPRDIVKDNYSNSMINRLTHRFGSLIFNLKQAVVIKSSDVTAIDNAYQLNIEIMSSDSYQESPMDNMGKFTTINQSEIAVAETSSEHENYKVAQKIVPIKTANSSYVDSIATYRAGDIPRTIDLLSSFLTDQPNSIKARELMVKVLLEQGDKREAKKVLSEGLRIKPDNTIFIKLYATLLFDEKQLDSAMSYLNKASPALHEDQDYYALKAAIFQRQERYNEAAKIYYNLVQVAPVSGIWWVGLGISLEGLGHKTDALLAYKRAQKYRTLTADIARFINNRIRALSG